VTDQFSERSRQRLINSPMPSEPIRTPRGRRFPIANWDDFGRVTPPAPDPAEAPRLLRGTDIQLGIIRQYEDDIDRLTAERDALRAAVERVKALLNEHDRLTTRMFGYDRIRISTVRVALAGAPAEQREANDG
jgi:hypothetical protein